jgi:hypothetical protein
LCRCSQSRTVADWASKVCWMMQVLYFKRCSCSCTCSPGHMLARTDTMSMLRCAGAPSATHLQVCLCWLYSCCLCATLGWRRSCCMALVGSCGRVPPYHKRCACCMPCSVSDTLISHPELNSKVCANTYCSSSLPEYACILHGALSHANPVHRFDRLGPTGTCCVTGMLLNSVSLPAPRKPWCLTHADCHPQASCMRRLARRAGWHNGWYEWLMYELFEPCNAGTLTSMLKECAAS